jgi:hypothetical protein
MGVFYLTRGLCRLRAVVFAISPANRVSESPHVTDIQGTSRRAALRKRTVDLVHAIRNGDEVMVENAVVSLSNSRRYLAPLAMVVGAFVMVFDGIKLIFTNWRLTIVQILPAMWIWMAMLDLKVHALRGKGFVDLSTPVVVVFVLVIAVITAASFFLNAIFAFAVATPGPPDIGPATALARKHQRVILGWGVLVGLALGIAALVLERWGVGAFAITMSAVVAVMMFCYTAVPSRLLGIKSSDSTHSSRDKLVAAAIGGAIGAVVTTPAYVIGRIGILMLGSSALFILGVVLLVIGLILQAGASGSVKAIKMSAKLAVGR